MYRQTLGARLRPSQADAQPAWTSLLIACGLPTRIVALNSPITNRSKSQNDLAPEHKSYGPQSSSHLVKFACTYQFILMVLGSAGMGVCLAGWHHAYLLYDIAGGEVEERGILALAVCPKKPRWMSQRWFRGFGARFLHHLHRYPLRDQVTPTALKRRRTRSACLITVSDCASTDHPHPHHQL